MVARLLDPGAPALRAARVEDLMAVLPAVAVSLPRARTLVAQWLTEQDWPVAAAEDIVLAIHEALANVVDHAYPNPTPGQAHLHTWVCAEPRSRTRRVVGVVTDRGSWNPDHRTTEHAGYRGHGLALMSGCMAQMHIQRSAGGTSVILISPTVPTGPSLRSLPMSAADDPATAGGDQRAAPLPTA